MVRGVGDPPLLFSISHLTFLLLRCDMFKMTVLIPSVSPSEFVDMIEDCMGRRQGFVFTCQYTNRELGLVDQLSIQSLQQETSYGCPAAVLVSEQVSDTSPLRDENQLWAMAPKYNQSGSVTHFEIYPLMAGLA